MHLLQNNKLKGGTLLRHFFRKKSHSAEKKIKRGDPLVSASFVGYVKKVKNERIDPLETEKISKNKSHSAEKHRKGGLFSPVRFCRLP